MTRARTRSQGKKQGRQKTKGRTTPDKIKTNDMVLRNRQKKPVSAEPLSPSSSLASISWTLSQTSGESSSWTLSPTAGPSRARALRQTPSRSKPRTPRQTPSRSKPRTPRRTPSRSKPSTPRQTPSRSSARTPRQSPSRSKPRTPRQTPSRSQAKAQKQTTEARRYKTTPRKQTSKTSETRPGSRLSSGKRKYTKRRKKRRQASSRSMVQVPGEAKSWTVKHAPGLSNSWTLTPIDFRQTSTPIKNLFGSASENEIERRPQNKRSPYRRSRPSSRQRSRQSSRPSSRHSSGRGSGRGSTGSSRPSSRQSSSNRSSPHSPHSIRSPHSPSPSPQRFRQKNRQRSRRRHRSRQGSRNSNVSFSDAGIPSSDSDGATNLKTMLGLWRHFRIADMWLVSRTVRDSACLWIPLLLLLPILLAYMHGGQLLEQARSSMKFFHMHVTTSQSPRFPHMDPNSIRIKIKQFFDENHHRYVHASISKVEVQKIAQGIVGQELEDLKVELLQDINQMKADQNDAHTGQMKSLSAVDKRLQEFFIKYRMLDNKVSVLRASTQMKDGGQREDYLEQMDILEQEMKSLGGDLSSLQVSHLGLLTKVCRCCRNDTFYAVTVRKHVNDIFSKMVSDGDSGSDVADSAFLLWLQTNYAQKEDMDRKLSAVSKEITQQILTIAKEQTFLMSGSDFSEDSIRVIVDDALLKYSADYVGMADYALESNGGSVVTVRCSETYDKKTALVSLFGIPLYYTTNSPRTVIQPDVHPGRCWALKGIYGCLVIKLAYAVKPSGFTMEHIPKDLSPFGNIDSAPKHFAVLGLRHKMDKNGLLLGNYTYNERGKPIQYFPIQDFTPDFFEFILLKILKNYGNPEYTCLYRFRVHGVPYKQPLRS